MFTTLENSIVPFRSVIEGLLIAVQVSSAMN